MTPNAARPSAVLPRGIVEIELTRPLPELPSADTKTGGQYPALEVLVRLDNRPIGFVTVFSSGPAIPASEYAPIIWDALAAGIWERLSKTGRSLIEVLPLEGLP